LRLTGLDKDRQHKALPRQPVPEHPNLGLNLHLGVQARFRARGDHEVNKICDLLDELVEWLDAEDGEGERG
jgi:hypothetical protein